MPECRECKRFPRMGYGLVGVCPLLSKQVGARAKACDAFEMMDPDSIRKRQFEPGAKTTRFNPATTRTVKRRYQR